ncbi:hypothetical protein COV53_03745 [Candidatus Gottesmanbacteria bacterium CG11_big_fil_rev_8_21_14_0_20_37_11]|uniref:Prenyltransferase alpha-alpha toroid domain-containing protein n=3 Tax=Candidatus Gottesmaniibacteriota TaxID=1752720 RepID=A0A2M7RRY9_9BACT|nr:MAG: hypothetical protein COX23_02290 [Candidatus Gottesmanbacteria bacterium CG23_combo_of_CG06-09_8_20_14_all_37_19]PIR08325.1 MAG: hypothetical protein COV53_03745 [Candidatus Gottesmanbacteria bacterium CG11_big_fil_rev_8_21_14_0_20_37_11]PIZ02980.1 MAG: hypothetical protein COY59_01760 [Candidatus Gottesmanbacteria bacterium CG_4_10_14_0_8_um_filter_37_24]
MIPRQLAARRVISFYLTGRSFFMFDRQRIIEYLEDKHLPDGGYFFAKVEPSSGLDTYFAVKTLKLLGTKPGNIQSVISFWKNEDRSGNIDDLEGLYLYAETLKELSICTQALERHKKLLNEIYQDNQLLRKRAFKTVSGDFGLYDASVNTLFTDILEGELKELYYFTSLISQFQLEIEEKRIIQFIFSLQNKDGGFGKIRDSQSATTYYALKILNLLSYPVKSLIKTKEHVKREWSKVNYLEDLFWHIESLSLLKLPFPSSEQIILFLYDCFRDNGGFSRSRNLGIPTIEYTYYAVSILKRLSKIHKVFMDDYKEHTE